MDTVRLNITLPKEVAKKLAGVRNKSSLITQALMDMFERKEREKLIKTLKEGYKAAALEDRKLSEEWDATVGDGID